MADYKKMFADALLNQSNQQDPIQQKYEAELMKQNDAASLAPTMGLIDHFTGSKLAQQVPKQESMKDKLGQLLQLRQQNQNQKLSGMGKLAALQGQDEARRAQAAFQEKMYGLKASQMRQKMMAPPKLGGDEKKAMGYTQTLLKEIPKLRALYEADAGVIRPGFIGSMMGQNDAEVISNALAENYGRLQSGGAINKDEEGRFLSRMGSMMDSKEIRLQKLKQIEEEIMDKYKLYGGTDYNSGSRSPSGGSPGDDEAFQWATQNPNDPRAQQILQLMGGR